MSWSAARAKRVTERQRRGWGPGAMMEERGEHSNTRVDSVAPRRDTDSSEESSEKDRASPSEARRAREQHRAGDPLVPATSDERRERASRRPGSGALVGRDLH